MIGQDRQFATKNPSFSCSSPDFHCPFTPNTRFIFAQLDSIMWLDKSLAFVSEAFFRHVPSRTLFVGLHTSHDAPARCRCHRETFLWFSCVKMVFLSEICIASHAFLFRMPSYSVNCLQKETHLKCIPTTLK